MATARARAAVVAGHAKRWPRKSPQERGLAPHLRPPGFWSRARAAHDPIVGRTGRPDRTRAAASIAKPAQRWHARERVALAHGRRTPRRGLAGELAVCRRSRRESASRSGRRTLGGRTVD